MSRVGEHLVRVRFKLEPNAWHGHVTERLWAEKVGGNRYRLRNSPFYAKGVSFLDIVFAEPDPDGQLVFIGVSLRSGHSTYRVMLKIALGQPAFREHWDPLEELGCRYEGVHGKLLAVDVPPTADIYRVYKLLESGEEAGTWDFEEGHCGHPVDGREPKAGAM